MCEGVYVQKKRKRKKASRFSGDLSSDVFLDECVKIYEKIIWRKERLWYLSEWSWEEGGGEGGGGYCPCEELFGKQL